MLVRKNVLELEAKKFENFYLCRIIYQNFDVLKRAYDGQVLTFGRYVKSMRYPGYDIENKILYIAGTYKVRRDVNVENLPFIVPAEHIEHLHSIVEELNENYGTIESFKNIN